MNFDLSTRARHYFDRAGFNNDRVVPVDPCVPDDHPAQQLLARVGGLRIGVNECNEMLSEIRNDIAFKSTERYEEIDKWARLLRTRLIGVAETHHRHGLLYLS